MPAANNDWARGYAKQALSDLRVYELLLSKSADKCHRLHFLQMTAEKTRKAYLATKSGMNVKRTHACVERHLPIIARNFYTVINDNNQLPNWEKSVISRLSREIELLAPACDDNNSRRDNSEYPWEDAQGNVCIPCAYNFPNLNDESRVIVRLIRLIRKALETYA